MTLCKPSFEAIFKYNQWRFANRMGLGPTANPFISFPSFTDNILDLVQSNNSTLWPISLDFQGKKELCTFSHRNKSNYYWLSIKLNIFRHLFSLYLFVSCLLFTHLPSIFRDQFLSKLPSNKTRQK